MFRTAPSIVSLLLFAAACAWQLVAASPEATSATLQELAGRLEDLPLVIGDWQGESQEKNEVAVRVAEAAGIIQRRYRNLRTGSEAYCMMMIGRPGPLSVHLPEVCYRGLGYKASRAIVERDITAASQTARFRVVDMENGSGPVPRFLRVYHSWNDGNGWAAPAFPRVAFARSPFLYKLYVTTLPLSALPQENDDPALEFIMTCLPAIESARIIGNRTAD